MRDKRITKEQRRHITAARRAANGDNFRESEKFLIATKHYSHRFDLIEIDEEEYAESFTV